jgi:hypothetical protein
MEEDEVLDPIDVRFFGAFAYNALHVSRAEPDPLTLTVELAWAKQLFPHKSAKRFGCFEANQRLHSHRRAIVVRCVLTSYHMRRIYKTDCTYLHLLVLTCTN